MTAPKAPPPDGTHHTDIDPNGRTPEATSGTDEEGEAPVCPNSVTDDDKAWVHVEKQP